MLAEMSQLHHALGACPRGVLARVHAESWVLNSSDLSSGANVVVNYAGSKDAAEAVAKEIEGMGVKSMAIKVEPPFSRPTSRCCLRSSPPHRRGTVSVRKAPASTSVQGHARLTDY